MRDYISTVDGVEQMWDRINGIMDNFDFAKVAKTMEALDWGWAFLRPEDGEKVLSKSTTGYYIPKENQIRKNARDLIVDAIKSMPNDEKYWSINTGGLKVDIEIEDYSEEPDGELPPDDFKHRVVITLSFVVEEYSSYWG